MASVKCRINCAGEKAYLVQIRLKGYPPQTATFKRLTDARNWAASTESAIREGRHFKTAEAKRRTLADLIDRYQHDVLPQKKASTARDYGRHLQWWREQLGLYALADITPAVIAEQRDLLATGRYQRSTQTGAKQYARNPATVNRFLAALSQAMTIAVKEWGWLEENPCRKVRKLTEPRGRVRYLSDSERVRLLDACKASHHPDLYPAVVLALSTGARRMELLGARWRNVDLKRGRLTLEDTKNGERRSIPLVGSALKTLQGRAKIRRLDTDLLFPSGNPKTPVDLKRPWSAALKTAEIEDFRWHDLRHSAASYLAMNGASLAEIAEVLGHKTLQMVKRYSHLSEGHVSKVVERMNSAIFGEAE